MVRKVIGYQSRPYIAGSVLIDFLSVFWKEGIGTWSELRRLKKKVHFQTPTSIAIRSLKYPILIRPDTEDVGMVISSIIREEYGQLLPCIDPRWLIDAGAYIGDTSCYFLSRFPRLRVIALEPNPPAFQMAKMNLAPYGARANLLPKALSAIDKVVHFGGGFGGASIQATGLEVEATSIAALMQKFCIPHLDILKMDIEGEEESIFSYNLDWLACVSLIIIEIHGSAAKDIVSRAMRQNGFNMRRYRSVWYCVRNH